MTVGTASTSPRPVGLLENGLSEEMLASAELLTPVLRGSTAAAPVTEEVTPRVSGAPETVGLETVIVASEMLELVLGIGAVLLVDSTGRPSVVDRIDASLELSAALDTVEPIGRVFCPGRTVAVPLNEAVSIGDVLRTGVIVALPLEDELAVSVGEVFRIGKTVALPLIEEEDEEAKTIGDPETLTDVKDCEEVSVGPGFALVMDGVAVGIVLEAVL